MFGMYFLVSVVHIEPLPASKFPTRLHKIARMSLKSHFNHKFLTPNPYYASIACKGAGAQPHALSQAMRVVVFVAAKGHKFMAITEASFHH